MSIVPTRLAAVSDTGLLGGPKKQKAQAVLRSLF